MKQSSNAEPSNTITFEELPDILTARHIAEYLSLSKQRVYELLRISDEIGGIPSFNICRSVRVEKNKFILWLEKQQKRGSISKS